MAKLGRAKGFWDILKKISVAEIAQEASRPISIALVGDPAVRESIKRQLTIPSGDQSLVPNTSIKMMDGGSIRGFDSANVENGFPAHPDVFDIVIDIGGGRELAPETTVIYSISELGGWNAALERILDDKPQLMLPLARQFPAFRTIAAQRIIAETANANAQFALLTGVTEAFPLTSWLLPVNSFSDIVVLTKNQSMMVLRLAAIYGKKVDVQSRIKELAPILGNAFGWRAIARELMGVVPVVGFLVRAMIAYAGTVTVGRTAQFYYETGELMSAAQVRRLYQDAYANSKTKVRALADGLKKRKAKTTTKRIASDSDTITALVPKPLKDTEVIEK